VTKQEGFDKLAGLQSGIAADNAETSTYAQGVAEQQAAIAGTNPRLRNQFVICY